MKAFDNCQSLYQNAKSLTSQSGREMECSSVEGIKKEVVCKEIIGVSFCLTGWEDRVELIAQSGFSLHYLLSEFEERIDFRESHNPGEAWKLALKDKGKLLLKSGRFPYTYSERMFGQLEVAISILKEDPTSRQALVSVWDPQVDKKIMGKGTVPCSLYYHFLIREDSLLMIYGMRSLDVRRFPQDIYLATKLIDYVGDRVEVPTDSVVFFISSLHCFVEEGEKK